MTDHHPSDATARTDDADDLVLERLLDDPQRRRCLLALLAAPDGVTIDTDWADDAVRAGDRRLLLYHDHLRPLARAGLVEWNPRTDLLTRGPRFERVAPLLRALAADRDRSDREGDLRGETLTVEGGDADVTIGSGEG